MAQDYDIASDVLIGAIKDPRRYAYMVEVNPWIKNLELRDALLYRGAIIAAWGYVETTLIEIAIRSSRLEEYGALSANYPYKLEGRIRYLRRMLDADGPFSQFRKLGNQFLDRFEAAADLRHVMAHARMDLIWGVEFTDYKPIEDGAIRKRLARYTLGQLEQMARKATRLSRLIQMGYYLINEKSFLPPLIPSENSGVQAG
jgi:hypothetical protein